MKECQQCHQLKVESGTMKVICDDCKRIIHSTQVAKWKEENKEYYKHIQHAWQAKKREEDPDYFAKYARKHYKKVREEKLNAEGKNETLPNA